MDVADEVAADLAAEQQALDDVVAGLPPELWQAPTSSPGWTVADQIGHLTYFDGTAALAMTDPPAFDRHRRQLLKSFGDARAMEAATLAVYRTMKPEVLLATWREGRSQLARAAASVPADARIEWYGPSMSKRSFLTARLMETWAHGQDVVDAVGGVRPPSDRSRHVAQLGVITRGWSYKNRGMDMPDGEVRVELTAPSGEVWTWGPDDAADSITGPAEDFCLVVTQRRHVDDTSLVANGALAREWMEVAQAFAGTPTTKPPSSSPSRGASA